MHISHREACRSSALTIPSMDGRHGGFSDEFPDHRQSCRVGQWTPSCDDETGSEKALQDDKLRNDLLRDTGNALQPGREIVGG